jgi:hypothetical protein
LRALHGAQVETDSPPPLGTSSFQEKSRCTAPNHPVLHRLMELPNVVNDNEVNQVDRNFLILA